MRAQKSLLTAFTVILMMSFPVFSQAESDTAKSEDKPASVTLQGEIVKVDVTLNNLRDARLSISRVRKAAANLYDEVTRQQMTMVYNPNMVGTTVITVPMPQFTGQLLPPRKKWVNSAMAEIAPIIELFKEDVDSAIESDRHTDVSEAARKNAEPLREDAFARVKKSFDIYKELEKLTASAPYDNNAIAGAAKELDSELKQLDKDLKKSIALLQKEAKNAKKA